MRLTVTSFSLDLPGDELLSVIAPGGLSLDAGLAAVVDKRGFRFEGGGGDGVELPLRTVPPGLEGTCLYLGRGPEGVLLSASFRASLLGLASVSVERVGVELRPEREPAVSLVSPSGFGVSLDLGPAKGSGYLERLPDGRYGGVLGLRLGMLDVKAFGLFRAQPSTSLLVVITADFTPPIELGLAITLNGVGGIAGVNYAVNTDGLVAAVQEGHVDDLLFPAEPAAAAPRIIETLGSVFREQRGSLLVGPMFRVGWGRPVSFVTADVAVIVELPSGLVSLLARGRVAVPAPEAPIIDLRIGGVGIIDAANGLVELAASLTGSRLLLASIDGGFALRIKSGSDATFILSAGGFHPSFRPPPNFPTPNPLSIPIADTPLVQIRFSGYFAVTPATVQAGAKLTASIGTSDLGIAGDFGFDALVRWEPSFGLALDLYGGFDFHVAGESLCSVDVRVHFDGPTPCWHIAGHASASLFFVEVELPFDEHWACSGDAPVPPAPAVAELLLKAAFDPRSWAPLMPEQVGTLVSLRSDLGAGEDGPAPPALHPLGRLRFSQRVVPLGREITRFGPGRLPQPTAFDVQVRFEAGAGATTAPVEEDFARADFFELTDVQRLTEPAFERLRAGAELVPPEPTGLSMPHQSTKVLYETIWAGGDGDPPVRVPRAPATDIFVRAALLNGAVAASVVHRERSRHAVQPVDTVLKERSYAAVFADTLQEVGEIARTTALTDIQAAVAARSDLVGRIEIVPAEEVLL